MNRVERELLFCIARALAASAYPDGPVKAEIERLLAIAVAIDAADTAAETAWMAGGPAQ